MLIRRQRVFLALLADPERSGLADYLEMSFTWGRFGANEVIRRGDTPPHPAVANPLVGYFGMLGGFVPPGVQDLTEFQVQSFSENSAAVMAGNAARTSCIFTGWRRTSAEWRAVRMIPVDCARSFAAGPLRSPR